VERRQLKIRSATDSDRDAIWNIFHEVVAAGDTYAFDPGMSREEALVYWFGPGTRTYVAEQHAESVGEGVTFPGTATPSPTAPVKNRLVVGTYILRANQAGPGSHVANAAFMVAQDAHGLGVGRKMAEHSLSEARQLGFRAMQFNFVVSTNVRAIHLWQQFGFKVVGTLPGAFRHPRAGYVDVYVMFHSLLED
jgi:ribosomal protein S18 acetylase RimI-like enzyme